MTRCRFVVGLLVALALIRHERSWADDLSHLEPEVDDPEAVEAAREYWAEFAGYERSQKGQQDQAYREGWAQLEAEYRQKVVRLAEEKVARLEAAVKRYEKTLADGSRAESRPYILLNLAQSLNRLADHFAEMESGSGAEYRDRALFYLKELETSHPGFEERESALYTRALILGSMGRTEDAFLVWKRLAKVAEKSLYGVYARVAVGDRYFADNDPRKALGAFRESLQLLRRIEVQDPEFEELRIQYRIAWASYRGADVRGVRDAAIFLLRPYRHTYSVQDLRSMQKDAVELLGDVLYESDDAKLTQEVLTDRSLVDFAPAVALRAMQRYAANRIDVRVVTLGEAVVDEFAAAREIPEILSLMAASYASLKDTDKQVLVLERLSMLLPQDSLWRGRYREDHARVATMEEAAVTATRFVVSHHYENGMHSGRSASFLAAAHALDRLLEARPTDTDAEEWRMRRANCYLFAGKNAEAAKQYGEIVTLHQPSPERAAQAHYQWVLALERLWREVFASSAQSGADPRSAPDVDKQLAEVESKVEEFANRFPSDGRAVDLLLVAAAANRDMNRMEKAATYWRRVLASRATPTERSLAIRGIVYERVRSEVGQDVLDVTRNYLRLENWKDLGSALELELKGVLSRAAQAEGQRLSEAGAVMQGGRLLLGVADEFKDIPDRELIYRDGAYMVAIGGDWAEAQRSAQAYLKEGLKTYAGDMRYLLGRAHEYQMRFGEAAVEYLALAQNFPKHARAGVALERAEALALADDNSFEAGKIMEQLGDRAARGDAKAQYYGRAAEHYESAQDLEAWERVAGKLVKAAASPSQQLIGRLQGAKARYRRGMEGEALAEMERLAQDVERQKPKLGDNYADLAGEVHYLLGQESQARFDDFNVVERSGGIVENVEQKAKYFEAMLRSYDRAAAAGSEKWSTRARYQIAEGAERFSDEVAQIPNRTRQSLSLATLNRFQTYKARFQALAKKYYGNNLIARAKSPSQFANNEWVKKSARRLSGYGAVDYAPQFEDRSPAAVHIDLPYQWSM